MVFLTNNMDTNGQGGVYTDWLEEGWPPRMSQPNRRRFRYVLARCCNLKNTYFVDLILVQKRLIKEILPNKKSVHSAHFQGPAPVRGTGRPQQRTSAQGNNSIGMLFASKQQPTAQPHNRTTAQPTYSCMQM